MYIVVLTTLMMDIGFMWSAEALLPVVGAACARGVAHMTNRSTKEEVMNRFYFFFPLNPPKSL
jgi:hypothetical protein